MIIQFYHLLSSPLEKALPKLMEKVLASGHKVVLHSRDTAQLKLLSNVMWQQQAFLPHGSTSDAHPEWQPIVLTSTMSNPNGASILVVLDGSEVPTDAGYEKLLELFDGEDEVAVSAARARWKHYKESGLKLQYNKQQPSGGWKLEAEA